MKKVLNKNNSVSSKLEKAAKKATSEAKRQNKTLGLKVLVAKADGLYFVTASPHGTNRSYKSKLYKKGNYRPVRVARGSIKLA